MSLATLVFGIYAATCLVAIMMMLREQRKTGGRAALDTARGLAACLIWPLMALVMLAAIRRRPA